MENLGTLKKLQSLRGLFFPVGMTALFAALLAIVTARHEMFRDELQAWLIARDSRSLVDLFHNLRYEGHPALWQLLLYVPAHASWNPFSMQWINYAFAVCEAFLIFSFRRLQCFVRTLLAFSFFIFYDFGVIARNYMLSALLLTAAAICLLEAKRRILGVVLLSLAINTHFFAIPVALLLYGATLWRNSPDHFSARRSNFFVLCDGIVLVLSIAAAYLTIRPPADLYTPQYKTGSLTRLDFVLISLGRAWKAFVPLPEGMLHSLRTDWLIPREHVSLAACVVSLLMLTGISLYLQGARARTFFLCTSILECVLFAITVHVAPLRHYGFLFLSLIIALITDTELTKESEEGNKRRPNTGTVVFLFIVLGAQCLAALPAAALDLLRPYSNAQSVSTWLNQQGLSQNPMVIQPDAPGAAILGYMQRPSAYYPACECQRSFVVWNRRRNEQRTVTEQELASLQQHYGKQVILISNKELASYVSSLHLRLLQSFSRSTIYPDETFYIYVQAE